MVAVIGPVVVREGGYAFDMWTPQGGLSRGYRYRRAEDAYYARRVEIGHPVLAAKKALGCDTLDEFAAVLAERSTGARLLGAAF